MMLLLAFDPPYMHSRVVWVALEGVLISNCQQEYLSALPAKLHESRSASRGVHVR